MEARNDIFDKLAAHGYTQKSDGLGDENEDPIAMLPKPKYLNNEQTRKHRFHGAAKPTIVYE